jgi:EAL domain-containing protein (putative c-di-GMP-specific phosphodiesterase class I)
MILTFREGRDGRFYREDLPNLVRALDHAIEKRGHQIVYPYARQTPALGIGLAALVRNPFLGADTQIRSVVEEAREDAELKRRLLVRERRHALMGVLLAGRVTSVYEPIVDVATKTVYGYEALARGPVGTDLHSPANLFEAAEQHRLVFELDCLCRQSGLDGAIGLPEGTHLFLNVRPTTIYDPHFRPDVVTRTLERSKLSPKSVVFEISEQESIANFAAFREIRDEYKALGFRFALDDTGAGYASLQAVIELQPDFVKVDRSFVAGVDTDRAKQSLVRALQSVADGIGAQIVGEGLDTLEELDMLGELNIPFGQGWLFGKPTPLR